MFRRRLRILYILLCIGIGMIAARLFYLQVLQVSDVDPDYRLIPRPDWKEVPAARGTIYDRNGLVLAEDRPVLNLAVQYSMLDARTPADALCRVAGLRLRAAALAGPSAWMEEVSRYTNRTTAELEEARRKIVRRVRAIKAAVLARAARSRRRISRVREETIAHVLVRDIPFELAARIEADPERFPGVVIQSALERHYPQGALAAQALGYVIEARRPAQGGAIRGDPTIMPGDRIGELGAERQFDGWLRGVPGYYETRKDAAGVLQRHLLIEPQQGRAVYLTIDAAAQRAAEEAFAGRMGGAVVMDVRTGEVLVLATAPGYDNNDLGAAWAAARAHPEWRLFVSRAMRDSVPCGSVIKPIVALAAAATGKAGPGTTHFCDGTFRLGRRVATCPGHHGTCDMARAIEHSCNVWFFKTGLAAGAPAIVAMARQFDWGTRTGIDLPFEWPGRLPTPGPGWYPGHTLNLSIGQGDLLVTPLQAAVLMAAIANGGDVLRPRILLKVEPPPDDWEEPGSPVIRRVRLPPDALAAVREGMRRVPISGTARRVTGLAALGAAAKTGTAQTNDPDINHAWIAGYVPWQRPRYAFAVAVHRTPGHGADTAGPIAVRMLQAVLGRRH